MHAGMMTGGAWQYRNPAAGSPRMPDANPYAQLRRRAHPAAPPDVPAKVRGGSGPPEHFEKYLPHPPGANPCVWEGISGGAGNGIMDESHAGWCRPPTRPRIGPDRARDRCRCRAGHFAPTMAAGDRADLSAISREVGEPAHRSSTALGEPDFSLPDRGHPHRKGRFSRPAKPIQGMAPGAWSRMKLIRTRR